MEPLVHYSQRDPLYDSNGLAFIGDASNDIKSKDESLRQHSHTSRSIYGAPEPVKQIIEKPVYIKEPEPIIEIIIKESNITLPPLPIPTVTLPPRRKEQVQVFYVKYKKNPNGYGKDSVIYDKPIPALSPHVPDEPVQVEPPIIQYEPPATQSPPPSTTLRAIIKPESETYHADKHIHITFGKQENEQYKRSNENAKEESAPEPAISKPHDAPFNLQPQGRQLAISQDRQFPPQSQFFQNRPPGPPSHNFQNNGAFSFKSEPPRFPQYRPFNQPPPSFNKQPQFGRQFPQGPQLQSHQQLPTTRSPVIFHSQHFPVRSGISSFQQFSGPQNTQFNTPLLNRQPVPYQPFDQIRHQQHQPPQQPQIQFPRTHTHFPIHQQLPLNQPQQPFNSQFPNSNEHQHLQATQQQFQNNLRHEEVIRQQQQQRHQSHPQQQQLLHPQQQQQKPQQQPIHQQPIPQQQFSQQFVQQQQHNFRQNQPVSHFPSNNQGQLERIIPPGGELIHSVPRFEQHISVPADPTQAVQLSPQEFTSRFQDPFKQPPPTQPTPLHNSQQHSFANNLQSINNQHSSFIQSPSPSPQTTSRPIIQISSTTRQPSPSTTAADLKPSSEVPQRLTEKDLKDLNIELPDEVPDDLREQLLSSGILKNAQISVLDYDKVGDIPLSALPPDQLANFYGAGGGQQVASGSEPQPVVVKPDDSNPATDDLEMEGAESEVSEVKAEAPLEMKVVHYDPKTEQGQQVQKSYVQEGATQVDPVALNDQQYNRYLPVKVNGAAFPIPDVPELKGRNITSVVVLAPVDFQENQRSTRDVESTANRGSRHLATEALNELIKNPSLENFKIWLEKENTTIPDKQAVVLLVTRGSSPDSEKEIFMYDIATQTVSKLSGELSSAFVDAAETNSRHAPGGSAAASAAAASNVVEMRVPYPEGVSIDRKDVSGETFEKDLEDSASEYVEAKIPLIDPTQSDNLGDASEQLESFVDISGMPVQPQGDLAVAASDADVLAAKQVSISSGYSKTGSNLFSH
ncbi:hypothetical protein ILUMI_12303 [Ignelater luminosus]|uniref:Uncharacterized protein n=1 Tax=Ignelater luminosus TaxID=2038154 RepID=A0A8K0G9N9_IGNLU|nr:hypothetical protein ILUMI_12303 [Ignelater luminosus]